jgi:protoheme IX farnesyltransferase
VVVPRARGKCAANGPGRALSSGTMPAADTFSEASASRSDTREPAPCGASTPAPSAFRDWSVLLKARITLFVFLAAAVGGRLGDPDLALGRVLASALLIAATGASASIFNQVLERDTDRLMPRTARRPVAEGRIRRRSAVAVATALGLAGVVGLALEFEPLAALLSVGTILAYVLVYTPLKRLTSFNTLVGAVPGAMPPLLGVVATAGEPGPWGWGLFATLFVWQFPHFMAIAWLYREDYAAADMKMVAAIPGTEAMAGRQAFLYCLPMLPASLLPTAVGAAGWLYSLPAVALALAYIAAAAAFARRQDRDNARRLMFTSLLYLPALLGLAWLDTALRIG